MAGATIALRCVIVMREMSKPCVVDLISRAEDAAGDVVPIPALPVEGKVFVCPLTLKAQINVMK